jgi:hypothetical protein
LGERVRAPWQRAAAPVAITCAVLAPLAAHWIAGRTLVWFDTARLYAPQRWLVDEALRAFRLPLWNPFMGAGMPFLADAIHGVLHPVSVLTAWLGTDRSADVLIGGYVACTGLGAAMLARDMGASRSGAAASAFAFGTSGFVLSMAGNLVFLAGAGSLPFCVAGLRRFALEPRPAHLGAGVAGAAVLAFAGDVQSLMVGGILALALAWEAGGWRGPARAAAAGAVGLLVAGMQLIPSAIHLPRSVRGSEAWIRWSSIWSLEPWRIPEVVLPGLLRGSDPYQDPVFAALAGPDGWPQNASPMPFAASVFVGLVPLALAVAGARASRRGRLLGLLALALLWIALGPALGADAVLGHVPVWRAFQYSEKLVGPLALVVAVLAALGLDAVVERRVPGWQVLAAAIAFGLAAMAAFGLQIDGLAPELASEAGDRLVRGAWHVLGAAVALGGLLVARGRIGPGAARFALAALVWCGGAAASGAALRPGDPDARLRSPGPALAAAAPGPRVVTLYSYEPLFIETGKDWIDRSGVEHAAKGRPAHNVRLRLDSLDDYCAMAPARLAMLASDGWRHWPLAPRRYGVTHLIFDPPGREEERRVYALATSGGTLVERVAGSHEVWAVPHREWASFPRAVRAVADERAALAETTRALFEESASVVIEGFSAFGAAEGRVLSVDRGLESLRVEAEADADATLVVADAWWPGWEATVDGVAVPIFRADSLVRAVRWRAGRHVLEMRYRPPEVRSGVLVSALGVGVFVAWFALLRRKRAGSRPPAGRSGT